MIDNWRIQDELLSDKVVHVLRELIVDQTFKPGARLVQEDLAERLGVSRMPIRDAFKRLALEGLVELDSRKGAFVAKITKELFIEVYTLRASLEPLAVGNSVVKLRTHELRNLESLVGKMDECLENHELDRFMNLNRKFHELLRSECTWPRLNQFVETLWNGLPRYTPVFVPDQAKRSQNEHQYMSRAIQKRDWVQLCDLVGDHINRSRDDLLNYLEKEGFFQNSL